ncbi:MAG: acyltransferase [Acidimicrobiales bacterium]
MTGAADQSLLAGSQPGAERHYLRQFDLFRAVACIGVVAQHSILWPVTGGAVVGWSLVMVLHATRESFFFLSTFLAYRSQVLRPRSAVGLWRRRFGQVLVPYLAWTAIYFCYSMATAPQPFGPAMHTLGHDLVNGYYQLYFLIVLFQIYLVLPGLVWLVRVTRRHHALVLVVSLVLQLAMMTLSHYFSRRTGVLGTVRSIDKTLITSRYIFGYQLYVVVALLAADHLPQVQGFVERHTRAILLGAAGVGLATEGYYAYGVAIGQAPGHASDLFQPVAAVWFLAAIAGLFALGWRWAQRAAARPPLRRDRLVTFLSDASGGFYLGHVLVLQAVLLGLGAVGLRAATSSWAPVGVVLFIVTVGVTAAMVGLLLRTRARFVLTGPVRSAERARMAPYPGPAPGPAPGAASAAASASAMAS